MKVSRREYHEGEVDLHKLAATVERFFIEEGFVVRLAENDTGAIIQARKGGIFRTVLEMDRALTVVVELKNKSIDISMGVAKIMDNIDVNHVIHSHDSIFIKIPEALWTYETEHHLWNYIEILMELGY